jgi:ornithine cyclodeaminase
MQAAGEDSGAMIRVVDASATRAALPFDTLVPALHAAFAKGADVPARHHHDIDGAGTLLLMPPWDRQRLGIKIAAVFPGNNALGLPSVHSSYLLCDAAAGRPLAILDGNEITTRRTIAVSALAASFLAVERAETLLIVGTGRIARLAAEAFAAVRPIRRVAVWNRHAAKARALAEDLRGDGFDAEAVTALDAAAAQADIITCATPSTEPIILADWLKPGAHLDLIGSFTPAMREADDACFARGAVYIDTPDALHEAGDLTSPIARGALRADAIRGTLADLCAGRVPGRGPADTLTVFKAVGTALADLAAASLVQQSMHNKGN